MRWMDYSSIIRHVKNYLRAHNIGGHWYICGAPLDIVNIQLCCSNSDQVLLFSWQPDAHDITSYEEALTRSGKLWLQYHENFTSATFDTNSIEPICIYDYGIIYKYIDDLLKTTKHNEICLCLHNIETEIALDKLNGI